MEPTTLSGRVHLWKLGKANRRYTVVTLPFSQAREVFKPNLYEADSGNGEQRQIHPTHARTISKDMQEDKFTPTGIAAGLTDDALANLVNMKEEVLINLTQPLPLIDGGHRFEALTRLVNSGCTEALDVPITAIVYLDTRNKENFLNAQKGRPVDKSHMLSLQVGASLTKNKVAPYLDMAMEIAHLLNSNEQSPFYRMIKFDSRSIAPLPISTLCATGASDLATSLVGLAKITQSATKNATWAANTVVQIFQAIKSKAPELLQVGRVLTPPPDGPRGSATMWIGLGNILAYKYASTNDYSPDVVSDLVSTAKQVCMDVVSGNFAGPLKRKYMNDLAYHYYEDVGTDGIPQGLLENLSYSAFGVSKPKKVKPVKQPGKRGRKPKQKTVPPMALPGESVVPQKPISTFSVKETKPNGEEFVSAPWEQPKNIFEEDEVQA